MFPTEKDSPFDVFKNWFDEAQKDSVLSEPTVCSLATVDASGQPKCRMVLLKEWDERGFVFFTNKKSAKGEELNENPKAALCFFWDDTNKQIRIVGDVEGVDEHESDAYFASRSRGSQIGAWSSMQSHHLDGYETLEKRVGEMTEHFGDGPIERPAHWGGFRIVPREIEFWLRGESRLHHRIVYKRSGDKWEAELLYP